MKMFPKHIINKLVQISKHQKAVKKILRDIEKWQPKLENTFNHDGETFNSLVDQQGEAWNTKELLYELYEFLEKADELDNV